MADPVKTGFPVLGFIFLVLAVFKFVGDGQWVVWAILGVLFGGLGAFTRSRSGGEPS